MRNPDVLIFKTLLFWSFVFWLFEFVSKFGFRASDFPVYPG